MRCATGLLVPNGRSRQYRYIVVNRALRRCTLHHRRPVEFVLIQDVPHSAVHITSSSRVASKHSKVPLLANSYLRCRVPLPCPALLQFRAVAVAELTLESRQ